jgi:hypothetical protein
VLHADDRWHKGDQPGVSRDVLGGFRATGEGWQTRMDEALREWIERREAQRR